MFSRCWRDVGEALEMCTPVKPLAMHPMRQGQQPWFADALIEPVDRHYQIRPAVASPIEEGLFIEQHIEAV